MTGPLSDEERVAVTERFYLRCYGAAARGAAALCLVAILVAYIDRGAFSAATAMAGAGGAVRTPSAGRRHSPEPARRRPYVACAPALAAVALARWWPAVDQNALYFAVVAPIGLVVCAAQGPRQAAAAVAVVAAATALAAVLDRRDPGVGTAGAVASATFGVLVSGWLLKFAVHWNGLIVLSEARGPGSPPLLEGVSPPWNPVVASLPGATRRLRHPPLTALAVDTAHRVALWMLAVRELIADRRVRREAWSRATGFHARELQVLLLLAHHPEADVARYLRITVKTVRNTADRALRRERAHLDGEARRGITREGLARELASTYPSAEAIEELAGELRQQSAGLPPSDR